MQYTHCIRPPWSGADGPQVPGVTVKVLPAAVLPAIDGAPELTGVGCHGLRYPASGPARAAAAKAMSPKLRMRSEVMEREEGGNPNRPGRACGHGAAPAGWIRP